MRPTGNTSPTKPSHNVDPSQAPQRPKPPTPLLLILSILAYLLSPLAAALLGRISNPDMPRDGTPGPWCADCHYALAGLPTETPCPECGGHDRATKPRGVNNRGAWILATAAACIFSHTPAAILWTFKLSRLSDLSILPFAIAVIAIQTILVSLTLAILAARARPRLTLAALLVLTVPQLLINIGACIWVLYDPPTDYPPLVYTAISLPAILLLPFIFILFAIATTAWIWIGRHRA